ncbi:MAG TPA: DNA mismatch repair protein MutS [Bacteroidota bacterium]|nr:DNA mismatch repair protein MutS [Bacteroidota bacterium]
MKAFLMFRDRDVDLQQKSLPNEQALVQDLELSTLFNAMSNDDKFLFEIAQKTVMSGLSDIGAIRYRQEILKDCMANPSVVKKIYDIAVESLEKQRKSWGYSSRYPSLVLHGSTAVLHMFLDMLKLLRNVADEQSEKFRSEGFTLLFAMLKKELNDEYFAGLEKHLKQLEFRDGVLISSELGKGNKGTDYMLRKAYRRKQGWIERIFGDKPAVYAFNLHPRDEAGARALSELKDRGINLVANALAQSADHILSFFRMLRTELAFYISCLNLYEQLNKKGEPVSFPLPATADTRHLDCKGLYEVCLALNVKERVVGNEISADGKNIVIITGANQGGKSTFLRSLGVAQLMMQCGMFVPAESFSSSVCCRIFTHYKREEDAAMESGKFDEELGRMSDIVENIVSHSMVLFNESFAATNEREGSEIATQIIRALSEKKITVLFVTHMYEFAHGLYDQKMENALFLRAERQPDGRRTFKIIEGEPLQTSYGEDLYRKIFGTDR